MFNNFPSFPLPVADDGKSLGKSQMAISLSLENQAATATSSALSGKELALLRRQGDKKKGG